MSETLERIIYNKLTAALKPGILKVINDTEKHKGHSGYQEGLDTHFKIKIASSKFEGLSHLEKHRLVYSVLKDELQKKIHALSITIIEKTD